MSARITQPQSREPAARHGRQSRLRSTGVAGAASPVITLAVLIALWEAAVWVWRVPIYLLPAPSQVAGVIADRYPSLFQHTWVTGYEVVLAFVLTIVIGIPIAVGIASSTWLERTIYPLLVGSQAVPKVAVAPLLTIWLGFGLTPKIVVAFLVAFFPVVISTVVGLKSVPPEMIYLGRSMGLNRARMFFKIGLPHASPAIMGGLKIAIALAVVGAIVGEFTGADQGLGYLLTRSMGLLDTRLTFAALTFLVVLGLILFALVSWAEALLIRWRPPMQNGQGGPTP